MDPHTARCLQLSTSINMPFSPYKPNRFPESVNRSRFPVNAPVPQRHLSNKSVSNNGWNAQIGNNNYQPSYAPMATTRTGLVQSRRNVPTLQAALPATTMSMDTAYFSNGNTPDDQGLHTSWSTEMPSSMNAIKSVENDGFGLGLFDQSNDFASTSLSGTVVDSFEDLVHLDGLQQWDFNSSSPGTRSWSPISTSSGGGASDFTDFPDMCPMSTPNSNSSAAASMSYFQNSTPQKRSSGTFIHPSTRRSSQPHSSRTYRTSPYSLDRTRSHSICSTPMSLPKTQSCSPLEPCQEEFMFDELDFSMDNTHSNMLSTNIFDANSSDLDMFFSSQPFDTPKGFFDDDMFTPTEFSHQNTTPSVLPSSGAFETSGISKKAEEGCDSHDHDLSDEPDLFGPLQEEQLSPEIEGDDAKDSDLEPRPQELRFEGDLYTPKFVRGHGNKREGWCGICKPGRWLVLKNSAYWYDKSFTHGISAATGLPFDGPVEKRRMSGNPDVWEGLCGCCGEWIALISSKKKGTTWFRHAYKCHTHQKAKDAPKRRREPAQNRVSKTLPKAKKAKTDSRSDTPDSTNSSFESLDTDLEVSPKKISALQTISSML